MKTKHSFNFRPSYRDNRKSSVSLFAFSKPMYAVQVCKATPDGNYLNFEGRK